MIVKNIELENFNNFEGKYSFSFDKLNLISGDNGTGKSSLGLYSILFCIYGYSEKNLTDLVSKGYEKSKVSIELDYLSDNYKIIREYPTSIQIFKNEENIDLVNNSEKQKYLNNIFKDVDYFRKFRMIDNKKGVDILESGESNLKKSLFSLDEKIFNNVKTNLLEQKRNREIYNKDKAVIYTHYPSEKRLKLLKERNKNIDKELEQLLSQIRSQELTYNSEYSAYCKVTSLKDYHKKQVDNVYNLGQKGKCPTCKQDVNKKIIEDMIKEFNTKIHDLENNIVSYKNSLSTESEILDEFNKIKNRINEQKQKNGILRLKLEGRLKQKDYCYSTRDVEIVKQALIELDNFSSFYLTKWLSSLEPLMNSILEKINFKVYFEVNNKGNFSLVLERNGNKYSYKDLSTGQKLILGIAFQLSILLQRGETGLIVVDEGFSSLSNENVKLILDLFSNLPLQLICILHRFNMNIDNLNVIELK